MAILALGAGLAAAASLGAPRPATAQGIPTINASVVAVNIPGASALSQVGTFLTTPLNIPITCGNAIPSKFSDFIKPGAILDPKRILVGSTSNFGAPLFRSGGRSGAFLSIDPSGPSTLVIPPSFASVGGQASTLGGAVQIFSANSPNWLNSVNNPKAFTANYTGVSNPLGLSNNNAFGRIWPANSPFGPGKAG